MSSLEQSRRNLLCIWPQPHKTTIDQQRDTLKYRQLLVSFNNEPPFRYLELRNSGRRMSQTTFRLCTPNWHIKWHCWKISEKKTFLRESQFSTSHHMTFCCALAKGVHQVFIYKKDIESIMQTIWWFWNRTNQFVWRQNTTNKHPSYTTHWHGELRVSSNRRDLFVCVCVTKWL